MKLQISTNNSTGFSAYVDQATGAAYLSDKLICTLTGMSNKTLDKIVQSEGVGDFSSDVTQALTAGGTQGVGGLRQASDFSTILFAWKPVSTTNKERKEQLIRVLMDAGATAYVYSLCGYNMLQVVEEPKPPVRVLPEKLEVAARIESLSNNTKLPASVKQLLIDSLVNEYIDTKPKLTANTERWVGVVQKAEELNYNTNHSSRTKLGHYASKQSHRLVRQREERLCNGEFRPIWTYLDNAALEMVIAEFFS
jgi:hypothetical protein